MKRSITTLISGLVLAGSLFLVHPISASSTDALVLHNYKCIAKWGCKGRTYNPASGTLGRVTYMLKGQSMNATPKTGYLWESCDKTSYRARWTASQFVKRGETPRY